MNWRMCLTVFIGLIGATLIGCSDDDSSVDPDPLPSIVIIYQADSSWAEIFADLLTGEDFDVSLLEINNVATANFSRTSLIIVESRTGSGYDWGTPAAVSAIKNSGKPVLGLGPGGARLFGQMGLSINWGHAWVNSDTTSTDTAATCVKIMDPTFEVFTTPIPFHIPPDSIVALYYQSGYIGEYAPELADSVLLLGREPVDTAHYTLTAEGRCALWGFTNSPTSMTAAGYSLFINIVAYMAD